MIDRFKFRAWDKNHSKMYYNIQDDYDGLGDSHKGCFGHYFDEYSCEQYIIMQSTGLKDKKGNLIYEGDILRTRNIKELGALFLSVTWDDPYPVSWCAGNSHLDSFLFENKDSEIVGNIYENPELKENKS